MKWVLDASTLFDFEACDGVDLLLELSVEWFVPDIIVAEELPDSVWGKLSDGASDIGLSGGELSDVTAIRRKCSELSHHDAVALVSALHHGDVLIASDAALRAATQDHDIEVHGQIWVLEKLVETEVIARERAASCLRAMLEADRRLPSREVAKRLRRWESSSPE